MRRLPVRYSHEEQQNAPLDGGGSAGVVIDERRPRRSPEVFCSVYRKTGCTADWNDWNRGFRNTKEAHTSEESVEVAVEDADGVVEAKDLGVDLGVLVIGGPCGRETPADSERWLTSTQRSSIKPFPRALPHLLFIYDLLLAWRTRAVKESRVETAEGDLQSATHLVPASRSRLRLGTPRAARHSLQF